MTNRIDIALISLQHARARLVSVLESVTDDLWEQQIYSDGAQWTLRQLLIHLALADHGQNNVLMNIAEGKNIIPEDYDLNRYNSGSVNKRKDMTVAEARESLAQSRARLIEWLRQQDEAVLDKEGRHASMQILSIAQILGVMGKHEASHAADIEALVQKAL